jgi:DNA-binding protein Fis
MNSNKKVLLLYPTQQSQPDNSELKQSLQNAGAEIEEFVINENIEKVLDALEQPVIPVVMSN